MQNLSQPFPKTSACFEHEGTRKPANNQKQRKGEKAFCIIGGESEALGFHQKIQERRNDHEQEDHNWFCIKNITLFPSHARLTIAQC